jgi:hypothetical protein
MKVPKFLAEVARLDKEPEDTFRATTMRMQIEYYDDSPTLYSGISRVEGLAGHPPSMEIIKRIRAYQGRGFREVLIYVSTDGSNDDYVAARTFIKEGTSIQLGRRY